MVKLFVLICLLFTNTRAVLAEDISVKAIVESDTVTLGEPFVFQIQVEGTETPPGKDTPNLVALKDFSVESLGIQSNSRSSITIVNGKMSKVEFRGYVCSYRLTPQRIGQLVIPPVPVSIDSKTLETQPVKIQVVQSEITEDFQLELKFSKTRFYVGEPVTLTVIWYIGRDVESFNLNLPILEHHAFTISDSAMPQDASKQYVKIPLHRGAVAAEKGRGLFRGREYTTVSFRKILLAKESGEFEIPEATAACRVFAGRSRMGKGRNPMDGFFDDDFFSPRRRGDYKSFMARSEPIALKVLPLPEEGRPSDFSGAVGHFQLQASANPTDVSVGDPITLTVSISGSDYLENLELPPLSRNPDLEADFKIPDESAPGRVQHASKVFTQTLRARSEKVREIPPVRFVYFDPDRGEYQVARSAPIPLQVRSTRVVTESDVEGRTERAQVRNELEEWSKGIAHNYEGVDVLEDQSFRLPSALRSPLWALALTLPCILYVTLFSVVSIKRRKLSDPERYRSLKALAVFKRRLKALVSTGGSEGDVYVRLLDALREYLGDKLQAHGAALTSGDVEKHLKNRSVDPELSGRLEELLSLCEQARYGGRLGSSMSLEELASHALEVVQSLDRKI